MDACVAGITALSCDALEAGRLPDVCIYVCAGSQLCKDVDCDDGDECTEDVCNLADSHCDHTPVSDGTECDFDGLPGVCTAGACESELCKGIDCDDESGCTIDSCDPDDGSCVNTPVDDGSFCDAGYCQGGECLPIASIFPCTEQGIRDAIAAGGGPHGFSCDGPTATKTASEIVIGNDVILDGLGNLMVDGNESHRVFSVPEGVTAELRRLEVSGGRTLEGWAGIHNDGVLALTDASVSRNSAEHGGGGIWNGPTGTLTMMDSAVSGNDGRVNGGIWNAGTATLTRSTVSGNSSEEGLGGIGNVLETATMMLTDSTVSGNTGGLSAGGISMVGTATLTRCAVSNNAGGVAGGISVGRGATLMLIETTVSDNVSTSFDSGGGLVVEDSGAALLTGSTVSGNSSGDGGGGITNGGGTLTLVDSTVSGNYAHNLGGGIFGASALTNSTVSGNDAYSGGGIFLGFGASTLVNSTVSNNTASGDSGEGGGILGYGKATLVLTNTTLAGNHAVLAGDAIFSQGTTTFTNTLVNGACAGGQVVESGGYNIESPGNTCGLDPAVRDLVDVGAEALNLGPLRDNGGPTPTQALRHDPDSVAIDQIPEAMCEADGAPLTTDQRGEPRPVGTRCDVGAFEVQP
ncbi:MAG: choice-of-anchor Q domain-containing protein [Woeseiaceae bacterium]